MTNLKYLREEKRLTLRELADKIGINFTALSRIETGNRNLNDEDIRILCSFFNVSSDYLLGLSDERNPTSAKEQLSGIQLAFYNQAEELTEAQAKEVLNYIEFVKNRDSKK